MPGIRNELFSTSFFKEKTFGLIEATEAVEVIEVTEVTEVIEASEVIRVAQQLK